MKLSKQNRVQIVQDYSSGAKATDLAKRYGIAVTTIYNLASVAKRLANSDAPAKKEYHPPPSNLSDFNLPKGGRSLRDENTELKVMYAELALELWRKNSDDKVVSPINQAFSL